MLHRIGLQRRGRAAVHVLLAMGAHPVRRGVRCDSRWGTPVEPISTGRWRCCRRRWPGRGRRPGHGGGGADESARGDERRRGFGRGRRTRGRRRARGGRRTSGAVHAPGTLRTGSRGCCSKEDAGDARRAADVLGIPFYVWDFADQFKEDVIDDFVPPTRRRNAESVPALQRADQVLRPGRPRAGAGIRRGGHRPLRPPLGRAAAARGRRRQGPVLRARGADRRAAAPCDVPGRRHPQDADPRRGRRSRSVGRREAGQPRHLLHPVRRHPRLPRRAHRGPPRFDRRPGGAVLATHDGVHGFTIGQRKGLGLPVPRPDGRPRYVTAIDAESGTVQVGSSADLEVSHLTGHRPMFTSGTAPEGPVDCAVQVRAHGETVDAQAQLAGEELVCDYGLRCGAWHRARRWCCTAATRTATRCSPAPLSPRRPNPARWRPGSRSRSSTPSPGTRNR